ncbi:MAG: hypothetical protein JWL86_2102 [Rhizobium sp.]|nr:hypothetical protein [Rhizobium sp.]
MFSYPLKARPQIEDAAYDVWTHKVHNGVALKGYQLRHLLALPKHSHRPLCRMKT